MIFAHLKLKEIIITGSEHVQIKPWVLGMAEHVVLSGVESEAYVLTSRGNGLNRATGKNRKL